MKIWTIIPIKHLGEAKSSLARVLDPQTRRRLVLAMLADMLKAISEAPSIFKTAVVSPDNEVLDFARANNALGVEEPGLSLNGALKLAISRAVALGARAVLLLPGDLPLIRGVDIENITAMATSERDVVISPSKANGTNALFLRPPEAMDLNFGGESFPRHLREAVRVGIKPRIYRSTTVSFDVDEPEDLLELKRLGPGTNTYEVLKQKLPVLEKKINS
ncbi:MAG: 2-phospho-L-lactate guanylyltransferase [Candidatus Hadarchaeum sp.]|uniref:2-phospho-L-lactate guanylyltransferase n=1 Tax=Candidatus Hadarchaeum sp. TaxID=2883567 RepID=UPI003D0FF5A0